MSSWYHWMRRLCPTTDPFPNVMLFPALKCKSNVLWILDIPGAKITKRQTPSGTFYMIILQPDNRPLIKNQNVAVLDKYKVVNGKRDHWNKITVYFTDHEIQNSLYSVLESSPCIVSVITGSAPPKPGRIFTFWFPSPPETIAYCRK